MIEQEFASIISYIIKAAGNPAPYYWNVAESFEIPSVFFPVPEISTSGDTASGFKADYTWQVVFFHRTSQEAFQMAQSALLSIRRARNLIPLIDEEGKAQRRGVRISDPTARQGEDGSAVLTFTWRRRLPYDDPDYEKMVHFVAEEILKDGTVGRTVRDDEADALETYLKEQEDSHGR